MNKLLALFIFLISTSALATPKLNQWCFDEETETASKTITWKYCIYVTEGSKNPDVLYHFHGLGRDNIETGGWSSLSGHYGLPIRNEWEKLGFDAPVVVSVSFGELWLLAEKNSSAVSGLYEFLLAVAIPKIEKNINTNIGLIGKRQLVGESIGGFNVSQMILKNPGLFTKAAMLCPAVANLTPFATEEEIAAYVERTGANRERADAMVEMSRYFFPTMEDWMKHSPLDLAKEKLSTETPKMYISCGDKDQFGFQEGALMFAQIGVEKTLDFTWVPVPGGQHCAVDPRSLAGFLAK